MAFIAGYNTKVYISGYDLSTYFTSFDINHNVNLADSTTFSKTQMERLPTIADGSISLSGYSDNTAGAVTAVLNAAVQQDNKVYVVWPDGDTIGNYGYGLTTDIETIGHNTPFDGLTDITASAQSNVGIEYLKCLHDLSAETSAGSSASIDHGAVPDRATGSAYIECTAFTGTSIAVIIEESTTDAFLGEETTLVSFASISGIAAERVTFATTPDRYLRATWTGTITSATFNVGVNFT